MKLLAPVAQTSIDLVVHLDAVLRHSRALLSHAQSAPEVFEAHFGERLQVFQRVPIEGAPVMTLLSAVIAPVRDTHVGALMLTPAVGTQQWIVQYGGLPFAVKDLADRSEWVKKPETEQKPPADSGWSFSALATDQIAGPSNALIVRQAMSFFKEAVAGLAALAAECDSPDYLARSDAARRARWGQDAADAAAGNEIDAAEIMAKAMGRLKRGPGPAR